MRQDAKGAFPLVSRGTGVRTTIEQSVNRAFSHMGRRPSARYDLSGCKRGDDCSI
jgi:hypothetical protein